VTNRALPSSMSDDFCCESFSVEVWMMACRFSEEVMTDSIKTFKLLILEGTFAISEVFCCASWSSRDHFGWFFFEAPVLCSFLFNEFSDDMSDDRKSERQDGLSF
jgi:hypothetical protein